MIDAHLTSETSRNFGVGLRCLEDIVIVIITRKYRPLMDGYYVPNSQGIFKGILYSKWVLLNESQFRVTRTVRVSDFFLKTFDNTKKYFYICIMKTKIYLDDIRTPNSDKWIVVRDYYEFVEKVKEIGLENIDIISLDHDLGDSAIEEYYDNVVPNSKLNYKNIKEKTGLDCAKWLVNHYLNNVDSTPRSEKKKKGIKFPEIYVHSANPIGAHNIMGYINNFLKNEGQKETCARVKISHF